MESQSLPSESPAVPPVPHPNNAAAPPGSSVPPPVLPGSSNTIEKPSPFRSLLALFLTLCLWLFFGASVVSMLDDVLVMACGLHLFTPASEILGFMMIFLLLVTYLLTGLTPMIPKRVIWPFVILTVAGFILFLPVLVYCRRQVLAADVLLSFAQSALVFVVARWLRGRWEFRWALVEVRDLGARWFRWSNLLVFALVNLLVLAPAVTLALAICASMAISHETDGFLKLRPQGFVLESRKYVRADGKTVLLFPMSHIADANFYRVVSHASSSNSIVLLEGVTDTQNLITNQLSYRRAARKLGLAEQHDDLQIAQGRLIRADVDVHDFSSNTIVFLNLVAFVHARGLNAQTLLPLLLYTPPPHFEQEIFGDLLHKRNEHLLQEFHARLNDANDFIIPWGAMHMPQIATAIQSDGFRLVETHDYVSIRFGHHKPAAVAPVQVKAAGTNQ